MRYNPPISIILFQVMGSGKGLGIKRLDSTRISPVIRRDYEVRFSVALGFRIPGWTGIRTLWPGGRESDNDPNGPIEARMEF